MATLVCVYAAGLIRMPWHPSRAFWIAETRSPSLFDWNDSTTTPSSSAEGTQAAR